MSIKIFVQTALVKDKTDGNPVIEVEGDTVRTCLVQLVGKYPKMDKVLFNNENKLHGYIQVSVNNKIIDFGDLQKRTIDGDSIFITIKTIGGG